jgi:hypothetical protein
MAASVRTPRQSPVASARTATHDYSRRRRESERDGIPLLASLFAQYVLIDQKRDVAVRFRPHKKKVRDFSLDGPDTLWAWLIRSWDRPQCVRIPGRGVHIRSSFRPGPRHVRLSHEICSFSQNKKHGICSVCNVHGTCLRMSYILR